MSLDFLVKIEGKSATERISTQNAPVKELIETLAAVRTFIGRTSQFNNRASVAIKDGSVELNFDIPVKTKEYLLSREGVIEFERSEALAILVDALAKVAVSGGLNIDVQAPSIGNIHINYNGSTDFQIHEPTWIATNLTLNGIIIEIGGKTPNIHLETEEYGFKTVSIDRNSIKQLRIYDLYAMEVETLQNWDNPFDIKDVKYISHIHIGDPISYGIFVERFSQSLSDEAREEGFFDHLRGRGYER